MPARLLFLDDLKDFEIFPRVDVGSFKPLYINRPQNNIAMIIRTQIPIKPAIKLFWFFKSASVKSKKKYTFLGSDFYELRLPGKATPHKGLNSPKRFTNLLSGSMSLILN